MELKPSDRLLLMTMPPPEEVRGIAIQVSDGLVVGAVPAAEVHEVRSELRDVPNLMITPADPEGRIPWKDDFFTAVYAPLESEPSPEMLRVVMPGGTIFVAGGPVAKR